MALRAALPLLQLATAAALLSPWPGPSARLALVALHVAAGALFVGLGLVRALRARGHKAALPLALVATTAALALLSGAERAFAPVVALHALVAGGAALSLLLGRRRLPLALTGAAALGALSFTATRSAPAPEEPSLPVGALLPDRGGGFLDASAIAPEDASRFVDVTRCQGCHEDVVRDHAQSAHRHASITNPYYQRALRSLVDDKGAQAAQFCAACHDHGLVVTGRFERALATGAEALEGAPSGTDIGIPCLTCHGASHVRSLRGNGALALALPDDPIVTTDGAALLLARALTRVDPRAHRAAMKDGTTGASQRCGACHQAALHDDIGGVAHLRSQQERDDHRQSAFFAGSGASGRLPVSTPPRRCVDCHFARERGGHASLQANAALPAARGDEAALDVVRRALEGAPGTPPPWSLSWLRVEESAVVPSSGRIEAAPRPGPRQQTGGAGAPAGGGALRFAPGDEVELHALVTNEGVGHAFPGGTKDLHRVWLEVELTDARGRTLARHPASTPSGSSRGPDASQGADTLWSHDMPEDAHGLGARMVDARGEDILEHLTERMHTPLWEHALQPGHGHIARYRFRIPSDAEGPLFVRARLLHRKFARAFEENAIGGRGAFEIPTFVLADTRDPRFALPPALRLARYADAAGAVWDDERAALALERAKALAPGDVEVTLAAARFSLERLHRRDEAARLLEPIDDPRARFLRAKALVDGGRIEEGLALTGDLSARFPDDVEVWRTRALALRRLGRPAEANAAAREILARQPDDFEALRFLMAASGEAGDKEAVRRYREEAEAVRVDREATRAALERQERDPVAAREADRVHVHELSPVDVPAPSL